MSDEPHLIWSIADIFDKILSYFAAPMAKRWGASPRLDIFELFDEVLDVDRITLYRCALVCKAWSPSALDLLWAALPYGTSPLLRLIPGYEQLLKPERQGRWALDMTHQITEAEWYLFQQYAARVKCIVHPRRLNFSDRRSGFSHKRNDVHLHSPAALQVLSQLVDKNDRQPLLPNLRILHWTSSLTLTRRLALRALAGPRLAAFYIQGIEYTPRATEDEGRAAIESDLDTLMIACPRLQHLSITGTYVDAFMPNRDHLVYTLANLRSAIMFDVIGDAMVSTLAMLPRLEVMDVEVQHYCHDGSPLSRRNTFPALREITARGSAWQVGMLVESVVSKRLSSVKLHVSAHSREEVMRCLERLPQLPCAESLKTLHLFLEQARGDIGKLSILLTPLLSLHQLEDVAFGIGEGDVTHADLRAIATAWPLLRSLKVRTSPSRGLERQRHLADRDKPTPPPVPALPSVIELAIRRPTLVTLAMDAPPVSQAELTEIWKMVEQAPPQTNMVSFDCVPSEVDKNLLTAALSRLFPNAAVGPL